MTYYSGISVSKQTLTVATFPHTERLTVPNPPEAPVASAAQATLKALWGRREQVVRMLEAERKRLAPAGHPWVRASVARMIEQLEAELAALEVAWVAVEASDAALAARGALVRRRVGLGQVVAWGLLAELPELGRVSWQAIAALAG